MKTCPYCAEEIQEAAIVCKHCGRDLEPATVAATRKGPGGKVGTGAGALIILLAVAGFAWYFGYFPTGSTDDSGRLVLPQGIGAEAPVVTKAEFDKVSEGMTYDKVKEIIGASGEVLSSSDIAGIKTVMYSWANANGSNMNATFQNGKMVSKAQFGLP